MAATVILADCPECGHELHGIDYAWCPRCPWADTEALDSSTQSHFEQTKGAI